jgi:hypothetical protein
VIKVLNSFGALEFGGETFSNLGNSGIYWVFQFGIWVSGPRQTDTTFALIYRIRVHMVQGYVSVSMIPI